jgi:hypothetical protein
VLLDGDLADAVEQHERHDEATQAAPDPDLGAHLSLFVDRDRLSHRLHDLGAPTTVAWPSVPFRVTSNDARRDRHVENLFRSCRSVVPSIDDPSKPRQRVAPVTGKKKKETTR